MLGAVAPRGYAQIERAVNKLSSIRFDNCYSSDSDRCRELSERLGAISKISPFYSPLFREISNGLLEGEKKDGVQRLEAEDPYNFKPAGGKYKRIRCKSKGGIKTYLF